MKKSAAFALAGVLIVAVAGGWWRMSGDRPATKDAKSANAGPPAALVTLATAEKQDVPVTVQVNGSVVSLNSVDLRPQVTNTVSAVHVKEGQFVKAGQLLFTLDDRNDQANLARARAQQQKDEATMADLERQYKRSQDLVAQNFIAKSAADATLSQLQAQRAAVAADRAAVQSAQVALGYATLRAPIAGRIGAVNIYPGTLVQPTLSLVTITQLDPIAVSFPVPKATCRTCWPRRARAPRSRRWSRAGASRCSARSTSSTTRSTRRSAPCAPRLCSPTPTRACGPASSSTRASRCACSTASPWCRPRRS